MLPVEYHLCLLITPSSRLSAIHHAGSEAYSRVLYTAHNLCPQGTTGLVIGHAQEPTCLDLKLLLPRGVLPPVGFPS